jgi:alpha-tubulin suppressor-like RCC1 family protein
MRALSVHAQVSCGFGHTAVLTEAGRVYTFGCGEDGQLGLGDYQDVREPRCVRALTGGVLLTCG